MNYLEFKKEQENKFNSFPMIWAFSNDQLSEGLKKFNCEPKDLLSIGAGGYIKKADRDKFKELNQSLAKDKKQFLKDRNNLTNAIVYELGNHEYGITYDTEDTIEALSLDMNDSFTEECMSKAIKKHLKDFVLNN